MQQSRNPEEILNDWLAGMTDKQLATKHGCSKTAGSSLAWKRGFKRSAKVKRLERTKSSERTNARLAKQPPNNRHNHETVAVYVGERGIRSAAIKYGYSAEQVRLIAVRFGEKYKLDQVAILKDYAAGVPLAKIVEKHGCHATYPATMAKRAGIKRRRVRTE